MFFVFIAIFILVPVIELNVLIRVGESLGSWTTVGLVFFTAIVGVSLVRSQGISTLMQVQQKLARGEAPGQEIVEGMMLALAGLLLLIPGFVTDAFGLLLLTPITRTPLAGFLYKRMQLKAAANGGFQGGFQGGFRPGAGSPFGQDPFNRDSQNPQGGDTFDGDFEHKQEPNEHKVEYKEDNKDEKR
ncbi:membrane protein [Shewanella hanedai]|uniref:FxsA family protein n=1 Tax=Shewanella hanedai TaxID=25 RepID=A0A553JUR6_SHEHA|nr:FxsA family protein [Shewanella hanedai]TRY16193.1 FxsA family protein [Shewanella hanedai]GGI67080.1 membrane protein [Shewanella hanedai]